MLEPSTNKQKARGWGVGGRVTSSPDARKQKKQTHCIKLPSKRQKAKISHFPSLYFQSQKQQWVITSAGNKIAKHKKQKTKCRLRDVFLIGVENFSEDAESNDGANQDGRVNFTGKIRYYYCQRTQFPLLILAVEEHCSSTTSAGRPAVV